MKKIILMFVLCFLPLFCYAESDGYPKIKELIETIGSLNEIKIDFSNSPDIINKDDLNRFIKQVDKEKGILFLDINKPDTLDGIRISMNSTVASVIYYGYKEIIRIHLHFNRLTEQEKNEYYKTMDIELKKIGFNENNSFFDNFINKIYQTQYNYEKDNINIKVVNFYSGIVVEIYDKDFDNKLEKMQAEIKSIDERKEKLRIEKKKEDIIKLFE